MNMHQPIQADPSPYAAYLRAAYKARRVQTANQNAPAVKLVAVEKRFMAKKLPLWMIEDTHFDAHLWSLREWRIAQVTKVTTHIKTRCAELGVSVDIIKGPSQKREVVTIRDMLIYEIKTLVDPNISWEQLARHFNRDHTSCLTGFDRGAAAAGDAEAAAKIHKRRTDSRRRYKARKGKG